MDTYYLKPSCAPNPFEDPVPSEWFHSVPPSDPTKHEQGATLNNLRDELAQIDTNLASSGTPYTHNTTPSQFMSRALEVEEQQ